MDELKLHTVIEKWPLRAPFRITGYTWMHLEVLLVTLEMDSHVGRGEAAGVYYRNETAGSMLKQIETLRTRIEAGADRQVIRHLLPPGGARNALDCALWDLESKTSGSPVWRLAGLKPPRPVVTTFTCGADLPETMAEVARGYKQAKAIKLKLTGDPSDADRVLAVRDARPEVWLGVDANQGFTLQSLEGLMPILVRAHVSLIEQPFRVGQEALLDRLQSPIPIAADESLQSLDGLAALGGRFQCVNIKLDKCGGLTEALEMAHKLRASGMDCMVGNMMGTSLAMAPAFLVGQLCSVVDLDGPVFLSSDRDSSVRYVDGNIDCPGSLWGA